jgi:hypothetical protein
MAWSSLPAAKAAAGKRMAIAPETPRVFETLGVRYMMIPTAARLSA